MLLHLVKENNKKNNCRGEETFLLPMAVAKGSPTHPAYPSGHAINVGAYFFHHTQGKQDNHSPTAAVFRMISCKNSRMRRDGRGISGEAHGVR